jgi:hypothetical protein
MARWRRRARGVRIATRGEFKGAAPVEMADPAIRAALAALERQAAEEEILRLSSAIDRDGLERDWPGRARSQAFDVGLKPLCR